MMFNERIKQLREDRQIPQRKFLCKVSANRTCSSLPSRSQKSRKQLVAALDIDTASYCKIEKGEHRARKEYMLVIAELLQGDREELLTLWLADQITTMVAEDKEFASKAF
jgi:transcriptional regulator with XRE-family HTH domain